MTIRKLGYLAWVFLLSTKVFAGSMDLDSNFGQGYFIATLMAGPAWAKPGQSHDFILKPNVSASFFPLSTSPSIRLASTTNGTSTVATGELFLGLRGAINSVVEGQFGVTLGTSSKVTLEGFGFVDSSLFPTNNFRYSFNVRNTRVAAKAKFLYDPHLYDLYPYLSGSAGIGFNQASNFSVRAEAGQFIPNFTNQTKDEFSFSVGVGLETALDPCWRLGLGYEFLDWGRSGLGGGFGQTVQTGLWVSHLHVHGVMVHVSYAA